MNQTDKGDDFWKAAAQSAARLAAERQKRRLRGDQPSALPPPSNPAMPPPLAPSEPPPAQPDPRERARELMRRAREGNRAAPPPPRVELHPDLQRHCTRTPFGKDLIQHPLLLAPNCEARYAEFNETYAEKRSQFDLAMAEQRWEDALDLVQQPHSWRFLWDNRDKFTPASYWGHLSTLWTTIGCFWPVEELLPRMLDHEPEHRGHLMFGWEREYLEALPSLFRVYRGFIWGEPRGWSWTLFPSVARLFMHRYDRAIREARESRWPFTDEEGQEAPRPGIATGLVARTDVIGLLLRAGEFEIMVCPSKVRGVGSYLRTAPDPDVPHHPLALAALRIAEGTFRGGADSIHGPQHWMRVDSNVIELCKRVPGADLLVCRLFAYLHDCQRNNEDEDRGHGRRAARFIEERCGELTAGLTKGQRKRLLQACRGHEAGRVSADPTVAVCWDADRIDLSRVDTFVEDEYLSTAAAKELKGVL